LPRKTHPIHRHSPNYFTNTEKNESFPLNQSLACANNANYVAIHACIGYAKKAEKIGKVMMRRVAN